MEPKKDLTTLLQQLEHLQNEIEQQKMIENITTEGSSDYQQEQESAQENAIAELVMHYVSLIEKSHTEEHEPKTIFKKLKKEQRSLMGIMTKIEFIEVIDKLSKLTGMKKCEVNEYLLFQGLKSIVTLKTTK